MANNKHDDDQRAAQARETPAHTAQQDHTPRREEEDARSKQEQSQRQRAQAKPAVDEKAMERQRQAVAAASIGAQVILDFNEAGSLGARGGAGSDIVENQMARDKYLVDLGLDPIAPSGPPPSPEVLAARRKREEERLKEATEGPQQDPKATRASSLAAGLDVPTHPQNTDRQAPAAA